jgi:hypothetical protein
MFQPKQMADFVYPDRNGFVVHGVHARLRIDGDPPTLQTIGFVSRHRLYPKCRQEEPRARVPAHLIPPPAEDLKI